MHLLQHLPLLVCILTVVTVTVFLIQSHALAAAFAECVAPQSVNSVILYTFNLFYYFAESIIVQCRPSFQRLCIAIGNSFCMTSLLTPNFAKVAVCVNDFISYWCSDVQGTLVRMCDKAAEVLQPFSIDLQRHCCIDIVAAGFCDALPVATEVTCNEIVQSKINTTISSSNASASAFAGVVVDHNEEDSPACLLVKTVDRVHFARSVPCYIPAELNGGGSGTVIMRSLHEHSSAQAVFGGPMTHHKDRTGRRVRRNPPRYGTVCKGKVSCDSDGRINARRLNNDSLQAIAIARKLFHEVYGRAAQYQRTDQCYSQS